MTTNQTIDGVPREHRLKIQKQPFADLQSGRKTCEIRDCSDREFRVDDDVILLLVDETGNPTQYGMRRKITHIQTGFGMPEDLCVLSYAPAAQPQGEPVAWRWMQAHKNEWEYGTELPICVIGAWAPLYAEQPAPLAFPGYPPAPEDRKFLAPVATPLDYGSLDAVQRLAVCRGDVLPASAAPAEQDRIKGMVETIGGQYAVMIDPENGHYGWTFKKHPDGQWVSGRKATEREMIAARSHAQITNQL